MRRATTKRCLKKGMPAGGEERRHGRRPRAATQHPTPSARGAATAAAAAASGGAAPGRALSADFAQLVQQGGPQGWDSLPFHALSQIFNCLELRDLAAAASVCSTWRYEASLDARWRAFWQKQVSDVGLWRWAKADGEHLCLFVPGRPSSLSRTLNLTVCPWPLAPSAWSPLQATTGSSCGQSTWCGAATAPPLCSPSAAATDLSARCCSSTAGRATPTSASLQSRHAVWGAAVKMQHPGLLHFSGILLLSMLRCAHAEPPSSHFHPAHACHGCRPPRCPASRCACTAAASRCGMRRR